MTPLEAARIARANGVSLQQLGLRDFLANLSQAHQHPAKTPERAFADYMADFSSENAAFDQELRHLHGNQ